MNIHTQLLKEHSKKNTNLIIDYIGNDTKRFDTLMECFYSDDYIIVQRSIWVVSSSAIRYPNLLTKHYVNLTKLMDEKSKHNAVSRNICKLFFEIQIPEAFEGEILNKAFKIIGSTHFEIAPKAFCMHIIMKYKTKYPELISELKELISVQLPYFQHSPGLLSVAKKVIAL
jgi:hypothetical protein